MYTANMALKIDQEDYKSFEFLISAYLSTGVLKPKIDAMSISLTQASGVSLH